MDLVIDDNGKITMMSENADTDNYYRNSDTDYKKCKRKYRQ